MGKVQYIFNGDRDKGTAVLEGCASAWIKLDI